MLLDTASWVEVLQLVLATSGVGVAFWKLWIAIENGLIITNSESTDLRRIVAETQVLGELFRLFAQGCLVAMGIISVLLQPPHYGGVEDAHDSLQSTLVRIGLITLTITMVVDSLIQEYRRRSFLTRVRETMLTVSAAQVRGIRDAIQGGTNAAHDAYEEANKANAKIADLNARLLSKEKLSEEELKKP